MSGCDDASRERILRTVSTFFSDQGTGLVGQSERISSDFRPRVSFSEDRNISPKDFLFDKSPVTDIERVAVLAYYLTHYRELPHFKTLDVSKLNTEAAQAKFANAATSVNNAVKAGLLAAATKGPDK